MLAWASVHAFSLCNLVIFYNQSEGSDFMKSKLIGLCRHFSGLSQKELAEMLGQSQVSICKYESGLLKPSPDTVRKMKEIFAENGVGIEEIDFLNNVLNKKD